MELSKILKGVDVADIIKYEDLNISGLSHNHHDTKAGHIFFAINGTNVNGQQFASSAVKKGAKVVVSDTPLKVNCCQIIVKDVRIAMSQMASNFYQNPQSQLEIVSLIGTNGKTTTSYIIKSILEADGQSVAVIGTNGAVINNQVIDCNLTTPDPIVLFHLLRQLCNLNIKYVVMEISAHAIYFNKVYGIKSRVGAFTNISMEHLDFFKDMASYAKCKMDYFNHHNMQECVINSDNVYGRQIAQQTDIPCLTYGIENPSNVFAVNINCDLNHTSFFVNAADDIFEINSPLVGEVNVYNLLCAISVAKLLKVRRTSIIKGIATLHQVDGRFNIVTLPNDNMIVVDFAHTPDGFDKTLSFIAKNRHGKIITLFGCVGYSDSVKRMEMARIAQKYSSYIIITSDNPGKTNFDSICKDITYGLNNGFTDYTIIQDRVQAVEFGIKMLFCQDTLVCLGKGAETKQKGIVDQPYNEMETINKVLSQSSISSRSNQ